MTEFNNICFIASQDVSSDSGFSAQNPATDQSLPGSFANNGAADIEQAVAAADAAFSDYRALTPYKRAQFLEHIAENIVAKQEQIVQRAMLETGLPEMRLNGETGRTVGQLRLFADLLREGSWVRAVVEHAEPHREPLPKPDLRLSVVPIGPVVVFGASNFPLAFSVAGGDTASALAAGCPVIVKSHSAHPGTSALVGAAISQAVTSMGLPAGTFSLLSGTDRQLGASLVTHPLVKGVGFTGSVGGGRALYDLCCARDYPIPFYGELGSTNPVYLLDGALANGGAALAEAFIGSMSMGCGQFCTNPGLIVASKGTDLDHFLEHCATAISATDAQTMLTEGIATAFSKGVDERLSHQGVDIVASKKHVGTNVADVVLAKVDAATWLNNEQLQEEVFGPFSLVIECNTAQQMLQVSQSLHGHLTATIHAEDVDTKQAKRLIHILETKVGRILMGGWPTGVEVSHAMQHGGPYPAATFSNTSVGSRAIDRWVRQVAYQNLVDELLPIALAEENSQKIMRFVDGTFMR